MSNALIGGLAQGIASGKQNAQNMRMQQEQQAMMQEYYKLQQEQIKQNAKLSEAKLKQQQMMDSLKMGLFNRLGLSGRQTPAPASAPGPAASVGPAPSAGQYGPLAKYAEEYYGLPQGIVAKVIGAESTGNPQAVSPKGAQGLMQLMPGTARDLGVANPFDPQQNVMGGSQYLRQMLDRFGGNQELALAAYNAGPEAVQKHGGIPPFQETQDYVRKIMGGGGDLPEQLAAGQLGDDFLNDPMGVALLNMMMGGNFNYDPGRISFQDTVGPNNEPITMGFNTITGKPIPGLVLKKPVQYDKVSQTEPGGQENTFWYNKQSPPSSITTKPGGLKPEEAGKVNVIQQATSRMGEINSMIFGDGDVNKGGINYSVLAEAKAGLGEGSILWSKMNQAIWGALRPESGALVSDKEIAQAISNYMPSALDLLHPKRDRIVRSKIKDFNEYIRGLASLTDPTAQISFIRNKSATPKLDLKAGWDAGAKSPEAEGDAWLKGQ